MKQKGGGTFQETFMERQTISAGEYGFPPHGSVADESEVSGVQTTSLRLELKPRHASWDRTLSILRLETEPAVF